MSFRSIEPIGLSFELIKIKREEKEKEIENKEVSGEVITMVVMQSVRTQRICSRRDNRRFVHRLERIVSASRFRIFRLLSCPAILPKLAVSRHRDELGHSYHQYQQLRRKRTRMKRKPPIPLDCWSSKVLSSNHHWKKSLTEQTREKGK
jgi:hypothetical protein